MQLPRKHTQLHIRSLWGEKKIWEAPTSDDKPFSPAMVPHPNADHKNPPLATIMTHSLCGNRVYQLQRSRVSLLFCQFAFCFFPWIFFVFYPSIFFFFSFLEVWQATGSAEGSASCILCPVSQVSCPGTCNMVFPSPFAGIILIGFQSIKWKMKTLR